MTEPHSHATPTDPDGLPTSADPYVPEAQTPAPSRSNAAPAAPGAPDGYAPEPAKGSLVLNRSGRLLVRLLAVVVVVVVGVIAYLVFFRRSDPTVAKVGDCVSVSGSAAVAVATRLSCDDQKALYVVTAAGKAVTCDKDEVSYTGNNRDRTKLCLFYNVRVGECITATPGGDGDAKVGCTAGTLKVLTVRTDTADETQCPAQADVARSDALRKRLICFQTVT